MKITLQDLEKEKQELDQRLESLKGTANQQGQFQSLGGEQQGFLIQQRDIMEKYSHVLGERIRTWNDNTAAELSKEPDGATAAQGQAPGEPPRSGNEPADPNDGLREPAKGETHKVRSTDKTEKTATAKKR